MRDIVRPKVLAVDDRPDNLLALETVLRDLNCDITTAGSGHEAVEKAKQHDFALILLDVQMPVMDGFATAKALRNEERSRYTPIIFITAIDRTETFEARGYEAGAVDYLFKPVNPDILRAKVSIFVELSLQKQEIRRQAELILMRDEFMSIASHELKTPITPLSLQMQTFLDLIETDRLDTVPRERLRRMLKTSYEQVGRLSRLINDLLDVSRFTSKTLRLEREVHDLSRVVEDVVHGFTDEIYKSGCEIKLHLQPQVKAEVDRFRIEQVVINLLTNALKYGASKPIEISVLASQKQALIAFKDHGIGISKADQARIFDRFERASSSRHFGGLGLGLYIASQIVHLHGGSIHVESELGQGATFTVDLPR